MASSEADTTRQAKYIEGICPVRQYQHTCRILIEEVLLLIQIQIAEHFAVSHVMAIQQGIVIMEGIITAGIQKNTSCQSKVAIYIRIDIAEIILPWTMG